MDGAKLCLVLFDTAVPQCDTQQKLDVDSGRKRRRRKATDFWKTFTTFQTQELSQELLENLFHHRNLNPGCVFFPKTSLVRLQMVAAAELNIFDWLNTRYTFLATLCSSRLCSNIFHLWWCCSLKWNVGERWTNDEVQALLSLYKSETQCSIIWMHIVTANESEEAIRQLRREKKIWSVWFSGTFPEL